MSLPLTVVALLGATAANASTAAPAESDGATALLDSVLSTWRSRDPAAWLALWDFDSETQRAAEQDLAQTAFASDETAIEYLRPPTPSPGSVRATADFRIFMSSDARALVWYWRLRAEKRAERWVLVRREQEGQIDGLVHLSLAGPAWRARGVSLRLTDFELLMQDGTLYSSPETIGPTALVFVGRGRIRLTPAPAAEREQLRRFAGAPALDLPIHWAFVRIHPAEFNRVIDSERLEPEPSPEARRPEAEKVFRARSDRSFLLDNTLPGAPWSLLPSVKDAVVDFPWKHRRVLTLAISPAEAEDVNLFDRDRRIQVCMYSSPGRGEASLQAARPAVDVLDQDLIVRFEPERFELSAVQHLRLRLPNGGSNLRLKLDSDFRVSSVATAEGTNLLFFRVREQGTMVVSLGTLVPQGEPFTLVVRYAGRHNPAPIEHELAQVSMRPEADRVFDEPDIGLEDPPLVYSNRTAWYARPTEDDFSPTTAVFDTPEGWLAVTGGDLRSIRTEGKRTRSEFRLDQPGKFVTAVVGRLFEVGSRQEGDQLLRGFATRRLRDSAREEMVQAERILRYYSELFGPCPYRSLGLAIAESRLPAGHSPPGLVYLAEQPLLMKGHGLADDPANFHEVRDFFLAHELAHQWWGQGTAPLSYRERWLSEAWAQYAAALWVRREQGEGAFRGMMDRMARWAARHDKAGPINLGQRLGMLEGDPRILRAVVYDKGAWVLHMLRGIMGDEAFFRGARAFLDQHRFARVGTDELRQALERSSGRDLRGYFERWIYDTGLPSLVWAWRTEPTSAGFRTVLEAGAKSAPGSLPLEFSLVTASGRLTRRVVVPTQGASWAFDSQEPPRRVTVNEDRGLLAHFERVGRVGGEAQR